MFTITKEYRIIPAIDSKKCEGCKNAVHGCFNTFCMIDECKPKRRF